MISVVVPCYNERSVLPQLYERLTAAARSWGEDYEVIVVDDGSDEPTWSIVRGLHARDPRWKAIRFSRNFGHQMAVSAGLARASGDAVVVLDADLQDPPEEIGRFLARWREGYDVVYAVRRQRKEGLAKRVSFAVFYRVLRRLAAIPIPLDSGDFCLMDRRVVRHLAALPERNRFLRGLRAWAGFRQIGLEYERHARAAGRPKYTFAKLARLAIDGICAFSTVPLHLATFLGLVVSGLALLAAGWSLAEPALCRLGAGVLPLPALPAATIALALLGGLQLVCLGIMGEYIGRIHDEARGRPLWLVRETLGTPAPAPKRRRRKVLRAHPPHGRKPAGPGPLGLRAARARRARLASARR